MTSNQHGPAMSGATPCYNGRYKEQPLGDKALISKADLSSDRSLQLDFVKVDSLVIAHQLRRVNTFLALYTPPVKPWKFGCLKSVTRGAA